MSKRDQWIGVGAMTAGTLDMLASGLYTVHTLKALTYAATAEARADTMHASAIGAAALAAGVTVSVIGASVALLNGWCAPDNTPIAPPLASETTTG